MKSEINEHISFYIQLINKLEENLTENKITKNLMNGCSYLFCDHNFDDYGLQNYLNFQTVHKSLTATCSGKVVDSAFAGSYS